MYYVGIFRKTLLLWLVIGLCGLLYPANTRAFSGKNIFPQGVEPFELYGKIMEVNIHKAYLIVAEKKISITGFKVGDQLYKTTFLDAKGSPVELSSFRKGQRVLVQGVTLPDGAMVAGRVQKLLPGQKHKK